MTGCHMRARKTSRTCITYRDAPKTDALSIYTLHLRREENCTRLLPNPFSTKRHHGPTDTPTDTQPFVIFQALSTSGKKRASVHLHEPLAEPGPKRAGVSSVPVLQNWGFRAAAAEVCLYCEVWIFELVRSSISREGFPEIRFPQFGIKAAGCRTCKQGGGEIGASDRRFG